MEPLLVALTGPDVWGDLEIHLLVELATGSLDVPGTVLVQEEVGGAEDWAEAADSWHWVVSGRVSGAGPAEDLGDGAVKEAEDGVVVTVVIGEVFEMATVAEDGVGLDAEPVNIAEIEEGGKTGADVEVAPEPMSVAELGLVVSACEPFRNLLSEGEDVWNSEVSVGLVFEPRVGFLFASVAEYMNGPEKDIQDTLPVVLPVVLPEV